MSKKNDLILIADDDDLICDLLVFTLETSGYKTEVSQTIEDTIKKAKKEKPALLILDLTLRDRKGIEVLEAIKNLEIPVIIFSGYTALDKEANGIKDYKNVKQFISKPIEPSKVIAAVDKILA